MEIYILRHGIAEVGRPGRSDAERKLTDAGREKLRWVLDRARTASLKPSLILTSPYKRAVETAEIAAEILGCKNAIVQTDVLLPSSSAQAVWRELVNYRDNDAILLTGHEPLLGEAASYLLGASRVLLDLKKGALLRIDVEELGKAPSGMLQWLLTAKLAAVDKGE
jgi:phosphohistidine phosphatase